MRAPTLLPILSRLNACPDAIRFVESHAAANPNVTFTQLWVICPNSSWLLWLAGRVNINRKHLVRAAIECAKLALLYVREDDLLAILLCLHVTEEWIEERADTEDVQAARELAANANAAAANAAAYAAAALRRHLRLRRRQRRPQKDACCLCQRHTALHHRA